jgi:hypothetical protein
MNPMPTARPAFMMPVRRRGIGLTQIDLYEEGQLWTAITTVMGLVVAHGAQLDLGKAVAVLCIMLLMAYQIRSVVWNVLDPINPAMRNRGFNTWTNEECFRELGFRLADLPVTSYTVVLMYMLYVLLIILLLLDRNY